MPIWVLAEYSLPRIANHTGLALGAVVPLAEILLVVRVVKGVLGRAEGEAGSMSLTAEGRRSLDGLPGQCSKER